MSASEEEGKEGREEGEGDGRSKLTLLVEDIPTSTFPSSTFPTTSRNDRTLCSTGQREVEKMIGSVHLPSSSSSASSSSRSTIGSLAVVGHSNRAHQDLVMGVC